MGFKGKEVSPSLDTINLTGGGVGNPKVGKYSKLLGLNHFTISGETRFSKLSPSKFRLEGGSPSGKISKSKLLETTTNGIKGELDTVTGVLK
jgi:hypothetical protein